MNRFKTAHPVELSGTCLGAPATARAGDHSAVADLIGAALAGASSSPLTQEVIQCRSQ